MRLFFYGTLMDADVRMRVLGRDMPLTEGEVSGFRRVFMAGRTYPMLVAHAGGKVQGLVADGVTQDDMTRLLQYEGAEYLVASVEVVTATGPVAAQVFMSTAQAQNQDWTLEHWRLHHKWTCLQALTSVNNA